MRARIVPAALAVLLAAGCSSAATATHGRSTPPATTAAPTTAPPSYNLPSQPAESSPAAEPVGTIDLAPNWAEMRQTLQGDWGGTCALDFSCNAADPLDQSPIYASFVNVPGQESITVSYVANDPSDNSGAQLDLGHFALFFSTDTGTQIDFQQAVSDAIDAIAVGGTVAKVYAPLQIVVQHPTAAKWQFKVSQSP
jgi:hypothetical protein